MLNTQERSGKLSLSDADSDSEGGGDGGGGGDGDDGVDSDGDGDSDGHKGPHDVGIVITFLNCKLAVSWNE